MLNVPVGIQIREEDPVFDDEGSNIGNTWQIDMKKPSLQTRTFVVHVDGDSIGDRNQVAQFQVTLEADVQIAGIRYVADIANGWLLTNIDGIGRWALPYGLKLMFQERKKVRGVEREFFEILEGRFKGRKGNVKAKSDGGSYFVDNIQHQGAVHLRFSLSRKELELMGTNIKIKAKTDENNPTPLGIHDLEIPYEPHPGGNYYRRRYGIAHAKTWFRIGHQGDRFLHPGQVSAGCITVFVDDQHKDWEALYSSIILARKDNRSIGTIEVVK